MKKVSSFRQAESYSGTGGYIMKEIILQGKTLIESQILLAACSPTIFPTISWLVCVVISEIVDRDSNKSLELINIKKS